MKKCPSHGNLGCGNVSPITCAVCSEIVRSDPLIKKLEKEYRALLKAKKKGRLPRRLFVRGMILEDKLNRVPEAFCPECLSLARKPSKGCKNHNKLYKKAVEDITNSSTNT